jgi:peptidoglycan/LPS O-acetylase OafA/YrhL
VSKKRRRKGSAPPLEATRKIVADERPNGSDALSERHRWPALTGLRGLAALAVFCLHAYYAAGSPDTLPAPVTWLFSMGGSGVDVFFTLSAFLLTVPFALAMLDAAPAPDLREYARHRLLRIVPAYYAQIAILIGLAAVGVTQGWVWSGATLGSVLAHLTFYLDAWPLVAPHNPPWWTLPVEMWFYLLLPLFARCLQPRRWWWLLFGIAASLVYRYLLMRTGSGLTLGRQSNWGDQLPGRLHQFLIGMLAAYAYVRLKAAGRLPAGRLADALGLISVVVFLALPALGFAVTGQVYLGLPNPNPFLQAWHLYASLAIAVLLIALAAGAPWLGRVFSWPPMRGLGLISYSFYLWHYPMQIAVRNSLGYENVRNDFWTFYVYSLLISVLVALASWWMIERPAQLWGRATGPSRGVA